MPQLGRDVVLAHPALEHVVRRRMAQGMRVHLLGDACAFRSGLDRLAQSGGRVRRPHPAEPQLAPMRAGLLASSAQVGADRERGFVRARGLTEAIALAPHDHVRGLDVEHEVGLGQPDRLGRPDPRAGDEGDQGSVAGADEARPGTGADHGVDLGGSPRRRDPLLGDLGGRDRPHRIGLDDLLGGEELEQRPQAPVAGGDRVGGVAPLLELDKEGPQVGPVRGHRELGRDCVDAIGDRRESSHARIMGDARALERDRPPL
jgi:hypothetical protein